MDAGELHGKGLTWDHVGGLAQFTDLLVYFANWVDDLAEIQPTTDALRHVATQGITESELEPEVVTANPQPARKVDAPIVRFVAEQCDIGDHNLVLAKDLYARFQEWCQENGLDDVSQRSFGMQLTAMGLHRRRRGRGKHWWDGIGLAVQGTTENALADLSPVMTNGRNDGYYGGCLLYTSDAADE